MSNDLFDVLLDEENYANSEQIIRAFGRMGTHIFPNLSRWSGSGAINNSDNCDIGDKSETPSRLANLIWLNIETHSILQQSSFITSVNANEQTIKTAKTGLDFKLLMPKNYAEVLAHDWSSYDSPATKLFEKLIDIARSGRGAFYIIKRCFTRFCKWNERRINYRRISSNSIK